MAANNIYLQVDFNSQNAQANVNALNQGIANTGNEAEKSSKKTTSAFASIGVSIKQVNNEFTQFAAAIAGLGISRAVSGMVQMAAELNRTQAAMQAFTGSAQEANEVFQQIRAVAAQSPFRFKDLEETAQRLMGFGMAAKNVPDTLKVITDQVARMGGTIEGVNTVVNVFGRIMEKNFVGAMDLMRALPAQGIPAITALRAAMEKELGHPVDTEEFKEHLKEGILTPLQTIRVILDSMRSKGDAARFSADAARAFKNLADTVDYVLSKFFGPDGFGPALTKLSEKVGELISPLGGLLDLMMKLPKETKESIVMWTAGAVALAAFGTALSLVTTLTSPLLGLVGALAKFTVQLALMNPELAITAVLLGGLAFAAYKLIPQVKAFTDSLLDPIIAKVKGTLMSLGEEGRKWFAEALKKGTPIDTGDLTNADAIFKKLSEEQQKYANEAKRTLLEALASPVEAVKMKYTTLFAELEEKMKGIKDLGQRAALTGILTSAQTAEMAGAEFKEYKKQSDERTRYQVERAKGAADAEIAYIEAQDAQDLRNKVRAIDQVTQRRIDVAKEVGDIEKNNLRDQLQTFTEMVDHYRADFAKAGIDVDAMIESHRRELVRKQTMIDQKSFDESQKYRLEGWKKANDAIIEDQKRVYDAFKDQFSQLFDAFTDKTKSLGQALGDFFKKAVIGEARELFSSAMAGAATQAAGYGRPDESLPRGGQGILGILLRRGTPPRPPLPPPELQQMKGAESDISYPSAKGGAQRFEIATDAYADSTIRFAEAVNTFAGAAQVQRFGSANRAADTGTTMSEAFQQASVATGVPQPLLRAVAQAESSFNPMAVSRAGARGLMQLMPGTAAEHGVTDAFSVGQNVMGGAQHLQEMLTRYKGNVPLALAAYNMGAAALDKRLASGRALPKETRDYVARITKIMAAAPEAAGTTGAADVSAGDDARWLAATGGGGGGGGVTFEQLANLPTRGTALMMPGLPSFGGEGGGSVTGPSVAELASLPQGPSAMARLGPLLGPLLGGALKAGGAGTGTGGGVSLAGLSKVNVAKLGEFFGIYGKGITSPLSILTSPAAGTLAMLGGMALASKGLQQHYAPATVVGGALAGAGTFLTNPDMIARASEMPGGAGLGIGAAAATGAGLGLFASGFQRGGGSGLAMDIGGGALAGAGIGTMIMPGLGTAIGAAIGAGVGAITGIVRLFVHTEQERIRTGIKQVYGIDISNQGILKQIQQIVDQKYGGSVSVGIRSQDVQDIVRLYALSTGQAANLPRPMYSATIAQSQAGGLATQPVYQGGVLVQNPYTGPTTYQYQTAVTAAQGLMTGNSPGAGGQTSSIFMQLNPQQANDLFTGRVVQAVQQNPAAVASANANATRSGDSRVTQASNMLEPLTSLG